MKTKIKKFLSVLLTISLVFGIAGIVPVRAYAANRSDIVYEYNGPDSIIAAEEAEIDIIDRDTYDGYYLNIYFNNRGGGSVPVITSPVSRTTSYGNDGYIMINVTNLGLDYGTNTVTFTIHDQDNGQERSVEVIFYVRCSAFNSDHIFDSNGLCTRCGHQCPHTNCTAWTAGGDGTTHSHTCNDCNNQISENHNWSAQDNNDGTHTKTCSICNYQIANEAHTYVNGRCSVCNAVQPGQNQSQPGPGPEPQTPVYEEESGLPVPSVNDPANTEDETPSVQQKTGNERNYNNVSNEINKHKTSGQPYVVKLTEGNMLDLSMMELLEKNPLLTIDYEYTYMGRKYHALIPGSLVKTNKKIKYYGPMWLYLFYGIAENGTPVGIAHLYPQYLFQFLMM